MKAGHYLIYNAQPLIYILRCYFTLYLVELHNCQLGNCQIIEKEKSSGLMNFSNVIWVCFLIFFFLVLTLGFDTRYQYTKRLEIVIYIYMLLTFSDSFLPVWGALYPI